MPEPGGVRASDQQREDAARQLREHFAAGRISQDELDERLQGAYGARTEGELQGILKDLPRLPVSPVEQKAELVQRRRHLQRRLLQQTGGSLGVFVICAVIWTASGAHGSFWPVWVAIFPLLALVRNGWRLYGPAPDLDHVERELERRERHRERHAERRRQRRGRRY
jgi:hypothetical protein